jgi:P27 family predicted phage terminase small subunit
MRRKSADEKKASGTYRPGRDRINPQFISATDIKAPAYIRRNKLAHAEWKSVAPFLEAEGILKIPDVSSFASYCLLYARWREATADVEKNGQTITVTSTTRTGMTQKPVINPSVRAEIIYQQAMMKAAVKFGLNPLDRPRVSSANPSDEDDPFLRFVNNVDDDGDDLYSTEPINLDQ